MRLPTNASATDVIDLLADQVMDLVTTMNAGRTITQEQYAAAFTRTWAEAFPKFLATLRAERPELAARLVHGVRDRAGSPDGR